MQRKDFLPTAQVEAHIMRIIAGIKMSFQALPARHAGSLAAEPGVDQHILELALKKAIDATLLELSKPLPPLVGEAK